MPFNYMTKQTWLCFNLKEYSLNLCASVPFPPTIDSVTNQVVTKASQRCIPGGSNLTGFGLE